MVNWLIYFFPNPEQPTARRQPVAGRDDRWKFKWAEDAVARLSADRFAVVETAMRDAAAAATLAERLMAIIAEPIALPDGRRGITSALRIPVLSLALLGLAALIVSIAAVQTDPAVTAVLLVLAVSLVVVFVAVDRTATATVLPRAAFRPGPLKWIYLALGLLMAATMVDMYVPLFGQRLAGLSPVMAGFMGAALSVGWTLAEIGSASISHRPTAARVVTVAPLVMAVGLGLAAVTQRDGAGPVAVAVWALALVVTGAGIGSAWPHLSVWAMGSVSDPAEQAVASAAVNTVQLICGAFGAGLAGVVVNLRETPDAASARLVFALFAALAAVGVLVSRRAARPPV